MPLKKLAKIIEESSRDTARARNSVSDPAFLEGVRKDRRKTLSSFETVQHALADRDEVTRTKAARSARTGAVGKPVGARAAGVKPKPARKAGPKRP
ncbi:MAG: hypothetical protein ABR525_02680 [Candidatus Limnocylindria bacterium]